MAPIQIIQPPGKRVPRVECGEEVFTAGNHRVIGCPIMSIDLLEVWGSPRAHMVLQNPKDFWTGSGKPTPPLSWLLTVPWKSLKSNMDIHGLKKNASGNHVHASQRALFNIFHGGENCPILAPSSSAQRRRPSHRDGQFKWSRLLVSTCFNLFQSASTISMISKYHEISAPRVVIPRCYEQVVMKPRSSHVLRRICITSSSVDDWPQGPRNYAKLEAISCQVKFQSQRQVLQRKSILVPLLQMLQLRPQPTGSWIMTVFLFVPTYKSSLDLFGVKSGAPLRTKSLFRYNPPQVMSPRRQSAHSASSPSSSAFSAAFLAASAAAFASNAFIRVL